MSINTIAKILIFFGIGLIVVAVSMDTTVSVGYSQVHNIGLISQQQNMLILGGLAFIAGVILIATAKSEPQEVKAEGQIKQMSENINAIAIQTGSAFQNWWARIDNLPGRIGVFVFVGMISATVASLFTWGLSGMRWTPAEVVYGVMFLGSAIYACRPISAVIVMTHLLLMNAVFFALLGLIQLIGRLAGNTSLNLVAIIIPIFFISASLGFAWLIRYLQHRKGTEMRMQTTKS